MDQLLKLHRLEGLTPRAPSPAERGGGSFQIVRFIALKASPPDPLSFREGGEVGCTYNTKWHVEFSSASESKVFIVFSLLIKSCIYYLNLIIDSCYFFNLSIIS